LSKSTKKIRTVNAKVIATTLEESGSIAGNCDALVLLNALPEKRFVQLALLDPPYNRRTKFHHYVDSSDPRVWVSERLAHLSLIRDRLLETGSVWIHLDDSEVHLAKTNFDNLFGRQNFVSTVVWQKTVSRDNRTAISTSHEYILVYAKNKKSFLQHRNKISAPNSRTGRYRNPDNDPRGAWTSGDLTAKAGPGRRKSQFYTLTTPSGRQVNPSPGTAWRFTEDRLQELIADNRVFFGNGKTMPRLKRFLSETGEGLVPNTWWSADEVGSMDHAKRELKELFPEVIPFDTPKPTSLIERIIKIATNPGDYVIDVYGGSGTTAAVAEQQGRLWITCEREAATFEQFLLPRIKRQIVESPLTEREYLFIVK
jgi:adenine-specific DNA-methyltransferase